MPELPEVETIKRDLESVALGQSIERIRIFDHRVVREITPQSFSRKLKGRRIESIIRRGKAIACRLDNGLFLTVQPMMTGHLTIVPKSDNKQHVKETKVVFHLSNGMDLNYNDVRLFGRLQLVKDLQAIKYFQIIGPEPWDDEFNPTMIEQSLKRRTIAIKTLLLNHTFVAGVGNIYASEICFQSKIHPLRSSNSLNNKEIKVLHRKTRDVLAEAIKYRGTSMRDYRDGRGEKGRYMERIRVYGRDDQKCKRCNGVIQKVMTNGRSTFFCGECQK